MKIEPSNKASWSRDSRSYRASYASSYYNTGTISAVAWPQKERAASDSWSSDFEIKPYYEPRRPSDSRSSRTSQASSSSTFSYYYSGTSQAFSSSTSSYNYTGTRSAVAWPQKLEKGKNIGGPISEGWNSISKSWKKMFASNKM